ncbi:PRC-barrel domain-containing protein [Fictibacillus phosphorivorans]|uniref:PRC-barrel domain-containing protein n=1 Tax=Fictibacillus phosphorivorans TaxID=1221500 RepID=UPI00203CA486|nr:PRC-barrel domain-containing protein [Fictibacillus phosphorivorans]MCM3718001.1 PRC-barrel domain-containing protein [Fictibacillus phosphorivorans]MCM3775450.1 PRC-barrel domain-containing protein [Fictibacillus phosphorivorans]
MRLYADRIIGAQAEHDAAPQDEHKVNDILFNMYDHRLCYFTFTIENRSPNHEAMPADRHMESVVAATSGIGTQHTPMTGSAYPEATYKDVKETYFIPWHQIVDVNEEKLVFKGNERQKEEPIECYSYKAIKDWPVIDQSGETVGKIKDLVMDTERKQAVGFVLSEGFWKSLLGHEEKYMPITGQPDWKTKEWKIERTPDLLLKNSPEEL